MGRGRLTYALLCKSLQEGDRSARGDAGRFSVAAESVEEGEETRGGETLAEGVDGRERVSNELEAGWVVEICVETLLWEVAYASS